MGDELPGYALRATVLLLAALACAPSEQASTDSAGDPADTSTATPTSTAVSTPAPPAAAEPRYLYDDIDWIDSLVLPGNVFEPPRVDSLRGIGLCRTFERYVVVEIQNKTDVGADVIVRPRASPSACATDSLAGDFVLRSQWAEYFMAIRDDWLFLDSGTGNVRGVIIYHVPTRTKLTSFGGDVAGWRDSTSLLIWVAGDPIPNSLCPKVPEGLMAAADSLFVHDLATNVRTPTGRWRCAARE